MLTDYPDTFALISIRVQDPPWDTVWGNARGDFYNIWSEGIPWLEYDGLGDAWPIGTYVTKLQQRMAVTTDTTIALTAAEATEAAGVVYDVFAEICMEPSGTAARTMRTYMVQVLDNYPVVRGNYTRNHFIQAATTEDITVSPGQCVEVSRQFEFDQNSWINKEDIKIFAWVQEPLGASPAEVYQAAKMPWPFPAPVPEPEIFADGFESGDTGEWP